MKHSARLESDQYVEIDLLSLASMVVQSFVACLCILRRLVFVLFCLSIDSLAFSGPPRVFYTGARFDY